MNRTEAISEETGQATNRLAGEKSPYLQQHRHNPVDWYPWGTEAFARARREAKPVFLSIGYSTCHWCHVMERESFEDGSVAEILNAHFVAIKVDREERPDVDQIYMTFVQAMTGQGGWPLNVFLTPELKPFYGGTYWPPTDRHGRPGFPTVLRQVQRAWAARRDEIAASAKDMHERLAQATARAAVSGPLPAAAILAHAGQQLQLGYDREHGGWGHAPKFPSPSQPAFLLEHGRRGSDAEATRMVVHTCDAMARGGIHDQLGGGFHRYSVDERWLVPHFEKMLYDNAQLLHLYLDCHLVSGERRHADVADGIVRYVLRDMTHPEGGFYSAEDADSEGKEGKFYCWTRAELEGLLTPEELGVVERHFGVTAAGNFVDHSDPDPLPGQNVLSLVDAEVAPAQAGLWQSARAKMWAARCGRVRPHLDDKVLASWNGLMLGALARAAVILEREDYLGAAEKNLAFLRSRLWDEATGTLHHRWREGERDRVQLLDAYAFLLAGVLELYQVTLKADHLEFAVVLAESMLERFYDAEAGGFWQSGADAGELILRVKDDYDGAQPSGNSVAVLALLTLHAITQQARYREAAERTLELFADRLQQFPQALPYMLRAVVFAVEEARRVVVAGEAGAAASRRLIGAAHRVYEPRRVCLGTAGPVDPFARSLPASKNRPTAYLCTGTACQPPTQDPEAVAAGLR